MLKHLLFGTELEARRDGAADPAEMANRSVSQLNAALRGIADVLRRDLGATDTTEQAIMEIGRIVALPPDEYAHVVAKRAVLVYALSQQPDIQAHYTRAGEGALVRDLLERTLPLVLPSFINVQAQSPEQLMAIVQIVHFMWDKRDVHAARPEGEDEDA